MGPVLKVTENGSWVDGSFTDLTEWMLPLTDAPIGSRVCGFSAPELFRWITHRFWRSLSQCLLAPQRIGYYKDFVESPIKYSLCEQCSMLILK